MGSLGSCRAFDGVEQERDHTAKKLEVMPSFECVYPIELTDPIRKSLPIGECIYCGSKSDDLSDEHTVPLSFGGNRILTKASCSSCAKITAFFEQICARKNLGAFRIRAGFPTRRRKQRPTHLDITLLKHKFGVPGSFRNNKIHAEDYPFLYVAPLLHLPPGLVRGVSISDDYHGYIFVRWHKEEVARILTEHDDLMQVRKIDREAFLRMISKIAYGHAIEMLGYGSFKPLLNDIILGKSKAYCYFIGGDGQFHEPIPVLHRMGCRGVEIRGLYYIAVNVRLFAFFGAPDYYVIVGSCSADFIKSCSAKMASTQAQ